jgi:hypothetical protein
MPTSMSSAVMYVVCSKDISFGRARFNHMHTFLTTPNVLRSERKEACQNVKKTVEISMVCVKHITCLPDPLL